MGDVVIWGNRDHFFTENNLAKGGLRAHRQNPHSIKQRANESSRQQSGQGRRKRASEDSRRLLGPAKSIRKSILYHKSDGRVSTHLSDWGLAGNRGKAFKGFLAKPGEEKISHADELLRTNGRTGWAGKSPAAANSSRKSQNDGRSGRVWRAGLPGSHEPRQGD